MRPTADELNAHLADGGAIVVATYTRSTVYNGPKYAGWFSESGGNLYVRHGRGKVCLSVGGTLVVGIRTGRYVPQN